MVTTLLAPNEAAELALANRLPDAWRVRVGGTPAVLTLGVEELRVTSLRGDGGLTDVTGTALVPGDVACVRSGTRVTWRRVLEVREGEAFVRADVAPFADGWLRVNGPGAILIGRVARRPQDFLAHVNSTRFVHANWLGAMGLGQLKAARRRFAARTKARPVLRVPFRTKLLAPSEWPSVQSFWQRASGRSLPLGAPRGAYVVGLFAEHTRLVGVNVQLVTGDEAYSAYTMIERGYRDAGGSRLLLDEAIRVAEALEIARVYVHIHARNVPSLAAYHRAGFRFSHWWADDADPMLSAERQWRVFERML